MAGNAAFIPPIPSPTRHQRHGQQREDNPHQPGKSDHSDER
jgi:hypothetical protein